MEEQERKREIAKYSDFVYDCFKKESNTIIGNFSYEGYKRIFENMIGEAKHSIYVFCENYDLIFTDELFCLFKFKADSGIKVRIITYGENREPKFEPLITTISPGEPTAGTTEVISGTGFVRNPMR